MDLERLRTGYRGQTTAEIAEAHDITIQLASNVLHGLFDHWVSCV